MGTLIGNITDYYHYVNYDLAGKWQLMIHLVCLLHLNILITSEASR